MLKPSVLKPVLATVEHTIVLAKLGRLAPQDVAAARSILQEILG